MLWVNVTVAEAVSVDLINPFIKSTSSVFEQMLAQNVSREKPYLRGEFAPLFDVTGIIGLSGRAFGTVAVSMSRETALAMTEILLQERPDELNAVVADAVGEVTNMIAGAAKAQMDSLQIMLGLPTVIIGRGSCIAFPSRTQPICIPFTSGIGPLAVEVGIEIR